MNGLPIEMSFQMDEQLCIVIGALTTKVKRDEKSLESHIH
jgi:hypothetical protein